jgi:hypothetical protein
MDIQLNFLQFKPQINWLDYFLQRNELYDLLNQSTGIKFSKFFDNKKFRCAKYHQFMRSVYRTSYGDRERIGTIR